MKKTIKILFTSVGRRVELLEAFKNAAEKNDVKLIIYGADFSVDAPALYYCDRKIKICRIDNPLYIESLLNLCSEEEIDLLIPTIDTDLLILAKNRKRFEEIGTKVVISDAEVVGLCRDKRYTTEFFQKSGVLAPITVDDIENYAGAFPCFIKPKDGSSSINAFKVNNIEELQEYVKKVPDYIIQPYIDGEEYTVDVFCDFVGNPIYVTPRKRLAVRSGEVLKTEIKNDDSIIEECIKIIENFKPCGAITIQLIKNKNDNKNYYIEINPRFGGGAPLSMKSGADSSDAMIKLLIGHKLKYFEKASFEGEIFSRFDQCICINPDIKKVKAVIFDLDDTLYDEADYVESGFRAVSDYFSEGKVSYAELLNAFENGESAIDYVLKRKNIYSEEKKRKCLEIYRNHIPAISLRKGSKELINSLKQKGYKIGIITDGRVEGQRKKIEALKLDEIVDEIIITDEIGGIEFRKPNDISYRIMKTKMRLDYGEMMYVGDNVYKDFIAPRKLGMVTVLYKNKRGLYYSEKNNLGEQEILDLGEILELLS